MFDREHLIYAITAVLASVVVVSVMTPAQVVSPASRLPERWIARDVPSLLPNTKFRYGDIVCLNGTSSPKMVVATIEPAANEQRTAYIDNMYLYFTKHFDNSGVLQRTSHAEDTLHDCK